MEGQIEIIVEYHVSPENRAAFLKDLRRNCAETLADRGCYQMRIWEPIGGDGRTIFLTEHWQDQAAIDEHRMKPGHDEQHARTDRLVAAKKVAKCVILSG